MLETVLIVEDDADIVIALSLLVQDLGFAVETATDGMRGLELALEKDYVLMLLDLMLPKLEGVEVCKRVRAVKKFLPIIALTSVNEELSKVLLLELGADDYITKPFSNRELKARIKTVLRRTQAVPSAPEAVTKVTYRELTIELELRRVYIRGALVDLTASEFDLLALLASRPGQPFSREAINESLYGYSIDGYDDSLNSRINRLRGKLELDRQNPEYLITVRGIGYRLGEP